MSSVISQDGHTYHVDESVTLPPLTTLASAHSSAYPVVDAEPVPQHLDATYFDTPDRRLARAHLALRRCIGGDGEGWCFDVPGANGGQPVRLPLEPSADTVPAALRNLVWASTRGETLEPVARVLTERTVHSLVDATGLKVIELADDRARAERVTGGTGGSSSTTSWRTVAIQLISDERGWLDALVAGLRDLGVRKTNGQQEFAWVRDDAGAPSNGSGPRGTATRPSPDSPAGDVVLRYVNQQAEQIITSDPLVRLDTPESVHRMRVATRRLRSSLQTFQPVLHTEVVSPLRRELKWLAGELGAARDAEVMRERMVTAMNEEDPQAQAGAAAGTVDAELSNAYRAAHDALLETLDSERYHQLVIALHELVNEPPLTAKAAKPAGRVLPDRAARSYKRLETLVATAHEAPTPAERDFQLHEARKAAKKARYAGETMTEFFGKPAARFAAAMENLQEELGEHQDSVVMRARIEELINSDLSPRTAFAYGRLHAHEERRGELAVQRFEASWRDARKKSLRAWIS